MTGEGEGNEGTACSPTNAASDLRGAGSVDYLAFETSYKKRGELLWAIASNKDFINLHSDAFDTVFGRNLVHV